MKSIVSLVFVALALGLSPALAQGFDPSEGLVGYYSFDSDTVEDDSGLGNHGVPHGGITFSDGVLGRALELNNGVSGQEDYVSLPPLTWESFTIAHWVRFDFIDAQPGHGGVTFSVGDQGALDSFLAVNIDPAGNSNVILAHQAHYITASGIRFASGTWHHIAIAVNRGFLRYFADGALVGETMVPSSVAYSMVNEASYLGYHTWWTGAGRDARLNGALDEVRLYDRVLGEDEIVALYLGQEPNEPPVALCADRVAEAAGSCTAEAWVDAGSYDPDGNAVTFEQVPPPPYGLGATLVTLDVTDDHGASDSCQATVVVVDSEPPTVECNASATMTPPEAPLTVTATALDRCSSATVEVGALRCFRFAGNGRLVDTTAECAVTMAGASVTVHDSGGIGNHVTWEVRSTDGAGNTTVSSCEVEVVRPGP